MGKICWTWHNVVLLLSDVLVWAPLGASPSPCIRCPVRLLLGNIIACLDTMWCCCVRMSCLAARRRLHRITPYPCYAFGSGVWLVRCCFFLAIAWACEWYLGCLCWLAPRSCIERSASIPLQFSPFSLVLWCLLWFLCWLPIEGTQVVLLN